MLEGKKILLGISASIAAYKSAWLVRLLVQHGAEVKVILSPNAKDFITPLTLSTLSKNPVYSDFTEDKEKGTWTNHVALGLWADLFLMAPASANTLSKMASGQSDNFLLTTYMSTRCPVMVMPAMDHDMFLHNGTKENLEKLSKMGHYIIQPAEGELASGLIGKGRMREPEEIVEAIIAFFHPELPLKGKTILVTAGPTYEPIDPVRFIGNHSSGKMGFRIAEQLAEWGARVHLVTGPTHEKLNHPHVEITKVMSASDMFQACEGIFERCDIAVLSAAVADYQPLAVAPEKIKKTGNQGMTIDLKPTIDIAATLGNRKGHRILIGFALETENGLENAKRKLVSKNLDMIVLNSAKEEGAGFGSDTNKITLIWPDNKLKEFGLKNKTMVARDIAEEIVNLIRIK